MLNRQNQIVPPTEAERETSIRFILDEGLPEQEGLIQSFRLVPFGALFAGVGDCLFLAVLISLLCLLPAAALASEHTPLAPLLFLLSPALYALLQLLTAWKERMSGTLEWKRTCRVNFRAVIALRMLCFGGAALLLCVPQCLLLWQLDGKSCSLLWMMGVSFSSLLLYGLLALRLLSAAIWLPPVLWAAAGVLLLCWDHAASFLLCLPAAVFFTFAACAGLLGVMKLSCYIRSNTEGGISYAVR